MMGMILIYVLGAIFIFVTIGLVFGERGLVLRRSTRALFKEQGFKNIINFTAIHSYIYCRWQKQYMKFTRMLAIRANEQGRKKFADSYHGKIITHDQAKSIITLNKSLPLRDLEQVVPYPIARNLLLTGPPDVVVTECRCRISLEKHCEPTQVCMVMGKPFTDFFLEHQPDTTRRLNQDEALDLLKRTHEGGLIHTAWFKDVMLNRMFSLCNCCKCCCGGTNAMLMLGMPILASSGYVACVDATKCEGCGICEKACHFSAIKVDKKSVVSWERCMGCGVCEYQCPNEAVTLVRDEKKGVPFDVKVMV